MGSIGQLISWITGQYAAVVLTVQTSAVARRLLFVGWLGALYIGCVMTFSQMIEPWFRAILESPSGAGAVTGNVVGLLFPPVAGTVMAGLVMFWGCVAAVRYTTELSKIVFKD